MKSKTPGFLFAGLLAMHAMPASAAVTTYNSEAAWQAAMAGLGGYTKHTFESFAHLTNLKTQIPGLSFTNAQVVTACCGGSYRSATKVVWNPQYQLGTANDIVIVFDRPLLGVGLWNTSVGDGETFKIYDESNALITSLVAPIGPVNFGGFITDSSRKIKKLVVTPGPNSPNGSIFIDDLQVSNLQHSLTLKTALVAGCKSVSGSVELSGPSATDKIVTLTDTLDAATPPASVTIPAGSLTKSFSIPTFAVAADETGMVSATLDGATVSQPLTVRRIGVQSLSFKPSSLVGGNTGSGTVKLECKAAPGPISVDLSASKPDIAGPVAAAITVMPGAISGGFEISSDAVLVKSKAPISAEANGIQKTKSLSVYPAASVSPTRLNFGNQVVGTMSAALTATLSNKGASPIAVDSIGLVGTYAAWFAQSNDCPATLDPGAACTISVTFQPAEALAKSAKLNIATSATSAPLGVTVSGTGVPPPP